MQCFALSLSLPWYKDTRQHGLSIIYLCSRAGPIYEGGCWVAEVTKEWVDGTLIFNIFKENISLVPILLPLLLVTGPIYENVTSE